ncbi:MAG: hypothetical protein GYA51_12515 [Candidatus Methanofastidiosa archaeon]|nr:hypothetical protein [Candidatus Methanofastidiosa archaeon]
MKRLKKTGLFIIKIMFFFLCVVFFPLGLFVLGWIAHRLYLARKEQGSVRYEPSIPSNSEEEKENENEVVVV